MCHINNNETILDYDHTKIWLSPWPCPPLLGSLHLVNRNLFSHRRQLICASQVGTIMMRSLGLKFVVDLFICYEKK